MQLKFWLSDANYITVDVELDQASSNGPDNIPTVTKAIIADSQLSHVGEDQLLSVAGQVIDTLYSDAAAPAQTDPWNDDERAKFRAFNPE